MERDLGNSRATKRLPGDSTDVTASKRRKKGKVSMFLGHRSMVAGRVRSVRGKRLDAHQKRSPRADLPRIRGNRAQNPARSRSQCGPALNLARPIDSWCVGTPSRLDVCSVMWIAPDHGKVGMIDGPSTFRIEL